MNVDVCVWTYIYISREREDQSTQINDRRKNRSLVRVHQVRQKERKKNERRMVFTVEEEKELARVSPQRFRMVRSYSDNSKD